MKQKITFLVFAVLMTSFVLAMSPLALRAQPTPVITNAPVNAHKTTGALAGNAYDAATFRTANDLAQASTTASLATVATYFADPNNNASFSAATWRTRLSLVIGTNVQAYSANLTTYAAIAPSANVQSLIGAADYSAMRTQLGLVIGTNVQAYDADLTTWAGITPGTGVGTALAVNVGTAGALVVNGGALGTPASGVGTNLTALNATQLTTGTVPTARLYTTAAGYNITNGAALDSWAALTRASGFDTFTATPTSANLDSLVTDDTGSGSLVFATSPTLVTPVLGVATATSINGLTLTASTGTLTLTNLKTLSVSNTLTLAGTDGTTMTFPATNATIARTDAANTFTGTQTITTLRSAAGSALDLGTGTSGSGISLASATNRITYVAASGQRPIIDIQNNGADTSSAGIIRLAGGGSEQFQIGGNNANTTTLTLLYGNAATGATITSASFSTPLPLVITSTGTSTNAGRFDNAKSINLGGAAEATNFLGFNRNVGGTVLNSGIRAYNLYNDGTTFALESYSGAGALAGSATLNATQFRVNDSAGGARFSVTYATGATTHAGDLTIQSGTPNVVFTASNGGMTATTDGTNWIIGNSQNNNGIQVTRTGAGASSLKLQANNGTPNIDSSANLTFNFSGGASQFTMGSTGNFTALGNMALTSTSATITLGTTNTANFAVNSSGAVTLTSAAGQTYTVKNASGNSYLDVQRTTQSTGQVGLQLTGGTSGVNWLIYQPTSSDTLTFFGNSATRATLTTGGVLSVTGVVAFNGATASSSTALSTTAGTTSVSSLRVPHGVAPTSPVDGDMWTTTAGVFARINGATVGPL